MDVLKVLGAVNRELREVERDGVQMKIIVASRIYETDIDDAWDALTNPVRISRWFLPISGELRVDGRYQLKGNASGTITACEPPRRFASTWEMGKEISWLEVRLVSEGESRTRLTLEHTAPVDPERWGQFGPGAVGVGWDGALLGLLLFFESKGASNEGALAWSMSEEGKNFYRTSSDAWCQASISFGTDAILARAAAARTAAFYTGEV